MSGRHLEWIPRHAALWCALCVATVAPPAGAQSPPTPQQIEEGRQHFQRGLALSDQGDHAGALAEFQRAHELSQRPTVLYNIAVTWQALHRYPEALDAMRRYLIEAPNIQPRERREAEQVARELRALIAHVHVSTSPPDAAVTLDGRPIPSGQDVPLGPGVHVLEATLEGRARAREEFTIASGEQREFRLVLPEPGARDPLVAGASTTTTLRVSGAPPEATLLVDRTRRPITATIELAPGPHEVSVALAGHRPWSGRITARPRTAHRLGVTLAPESSGLHPVWFWTSVAATGVFLTGSIVTGALAISTHGQFSQLDRASPEVDRLASRGSAFALTADILGVAAVATGAVSIWLFTRTDFRPSTSTAEFALAPTPGGVAFSSRFRY